MLQKSKVNPEKVNKKERKYQRKKKMGVFNYYIIKFAML
jgi:hypothetical protein